MQIYPAIDLRGGRVVRLKEGDPTRQTVFSDNPLDTARRWIDEGATWLHVVNLDGAFAAANSNGDILAQLARLDVQVQFGGGLRQMRDIEDAIDRGAARIVLGTAAIEQPELVTGSVARWGAECVCVALDARNGRVATHGWQQISNLTPIDVGRQMARLGVRHALYTDVSRDGGLAGVNIEATVALARATDLGVIASGGVSSLAEIEQLAAGGVVAGAVIGMALYEARLTLPDVLAAAEGNHAR